GLSNRLAGFEIRDTLGWVYGSGMPKSHNISKAIDKAAGAERKVVGPYDRRSVYDNRNRASDGAGSSQCAVGNAAISLTAPATSEAQRWDGWGTALKPAIEPILLCRKPLDGTVANNVLAHGVGGLNIDACRVSTDDDTQRVSNAGTNGDGWRMGKSYHINGGSPAGRFPANVLLDEHAAKEMDKQSGHIPPSRRVAKRDYIYENTGEFLNNFASYSKGRVLGHSDSGGASRFFPVFKYQAKAPKKERPVIEREAVYGLRDDLTEDQVDYVLARLREAGVETG